MDLNKKWECLCEAARTAESSWSEFYPPLAEGIHKDAEGFCNQPDPTDETEYWKRGVALSEMTWGWSSAGSNARKQAMTDA
ncbi:MAG: hypothetical protein QGH33_19435 [Pirellulaceae bacterium]|jgi:hypothetical protein|nr:hypothetical protein [Pirellulaceae bacterium]MDP7302979.1 hypothetical protein [Pirellulaceae bacterium]HJN11701.1 hypothetical protein [Pirellulaceae bacterium]